MKSTTLETAIMNTNKTIKKNILNGYSYSVERESEKLNKLLYIRALISNISFDQDIEKLIIGYVHDIQNSYEHSAYRTLCKITEMIELMGSVNSQTTEEKGIKIMVDGKEITINQLVAGLSANPATKNTAMEISMAVMTGKVESILDSIREEM